MLSVEIQLEKNVRSFLFRCIEDKNTFSCVGAGSYFEGVVAFAGEGSGDLIRSPGLRQRIILSE